MVTFYPKLGENQIKIGTKRRSKIGENDYLAD